MAEIEDLDAIILHFDTDEHAIPLEQFVSAANSIEAITENINTVMFGGELKIRYYVGTPKTGGVIELIYPLIIGYGIGVLTNLGSSLCDGIIKGFTKKNVYEWGEQIGISGEELAARFSNKDKPPKENDESNRLLIGKIMSETTTGFIRSEVVELEQIGVVNDNFSQALNARNKIFEDIINNPKVKGLGFDNSHDFTYQRNDLPRNIVSIPKRAPVEELEETEQIVWIEEITDIVVHSPNWVREGRNWQASNKKFKSITFKIEDEAFWKHVDVKDIIPKIKDSMKVQLAYILEDSKPKNVRVLRVLTYNGTKISKALSGDALSQALNEYIPVKKENDDLFDWDEKQKNLIEPPKDTL